MPANQQIKSEQNNQFSQEYFLLFLLFIVIVITDEIQPGYRRTDSQANGQWSSLVIGFYPVVTEL